jgi:hypothetical protein
MGGSRICLARRINTGLAAMTRSSWRTRKKYRPGIDDPPPTAAQWIASILGLSAMLALITINSRRIRKFFRREE